MLAKYLEMEENLIRKKVLQMGDSTKQAIEQSIQSYYQKDLKLAEEIIANDVSINALEKEIEEACISLIVRQQPAARDLREILANINIASELERIADYAVSIAKIVQSLPGGYKLKENEIDNLADNCIAMLIEVMVDYAEKDAKKANVCALKDNEVDKLEAQLNHQIFEDMINDPDNVVYSNYKLGIIHLLERIGDRVTNIAEGVVFLATGKHVDLN